MLNRRHQLVVDQNKQLTDQNSYFNQEITQFQEGYTIYRQQIAQLENRVKQLTDEILVLKEKNDSWINYFNDPRRQEVVQVPPSPPSQSFPGEVHEAAIAGALGVLSVTVRTKPAPKPAPKSISKRRSNSQPPPPRWADDMELERDSDKHDDAKEPKEEQPSSPKEGAEESPTSWADAVRMRTANSQDTPPPKPVMCHAPLVNFSKLKHRVYTMTQDERYFFEKIVPDVCFCPGVITFRFVKETRRFFEKFNDVDGGKWTTESLYKHVTSLEKDLKCPEVEDSITKKDTDTKKELQQMTIFVYMYRVIHTLKREHEKLKKPHEEGWKINKPPTMLMWNMNTKLCLRYTAGGHAPTYSDYGSPQYCTHVTHDCSKYQIDPFRSCMDAHSLSEVRASATKYYRPVQKLERTKVWCTLFNAISTGFQKHNSG